MIGKKMRKRRYYNPVRVHFGEGALNRLPEFVAGRKILVVTFPEASHTNLLHRLEALAGDLLVGLIDDIPALPEKDGLRALYDSVRREFSDAQAIVAVGGGSVMDTGKVLATLSPERSFAGILRAIDEGKNDSLSALPLIAVPTTAGTGSEVTPWATFWDKSAGIKYSLHHRELFTEAALVDPALTHSLPSGPALASGLDALSHALEAIWNRNANPVSDMLAVKAAASIFRCLPGLINNPHRVRFRSEMAKAALFAGLAFSNTQTALAHSISYPMTLRYGLAHGIACSFCLPLVMRKAIGRNSQRDAVLQRVFGDDLRGAPGFLNDFLQGLGVCTSFSGYGVSEKEAENMIEAAGSGPRGRNFIEADHFNPGAGKKYSNEMRPAEHFHENS